MNRIALLCLGFFLSFRVLAFHAPDEVKTSGTNYASGLKQAEIMPVRFQQQAQFRSFSITQEVEEREDLLTELTIYGLIILVYSLYWLKNKPVN